MSFCWSPPAVTYSVWNVGTAIHEGGHTQRRLMVGRVYGRGPEEFKAEHVSHNEGGYMDVKRLYRDIGYVSDVSPTAIVEGAIREQDASGTLTARLANQFGLKAMFLMMVNAPLAYRAGVHGEDYINLSTQADTDS